MVNDSFGILATAKQVGYYFAPSGKPYPDNWIITDVVYELEGSLYTRSGNLIERTSGVASGDETVCKLSCKEKHGPLRDDDCYWDYAKARCALPEYCEYRYAFGDVHLGQSCRLKDSSMDLLLRYL